MTVDMAIEKDVLDELLAGRDPGVKRPELIGGHFN